MTSNMNYLIVRKRELDPAELYPFEDFDDAWTFYDQARQQWSDTYFCKILRGNTKEEKILNFRSGYLP